MCLREEEESTGTRIGGVQVVLEYCESELCVDVPWGDSAAVTRNLEDPDELVPFSAGLEARPPVMALRRQGWK
jgi:hypothetical protein